MKIVTILGDDITVDVSYLDDLVNYVVNSKSIYELLTQYYYKIYFINTFYGSKFIKINDL